MRGVSLFLAFALLAPPLGAQNQGEGLAVGRQMLAEDNPGELWVQRGEQLFHEKRGPKGVSLERCDLGLGPGRVEGAFAQLPRYFADTGQVQDLESRLMTCMVELQGLKRETIVAQRFGNLDRDSDMEALVSYIGSKSNGMKMNVPLAHPREREVYKTGEYLFFRRSGPLDFSCATCHSEEGKRVRLQDLPNMSDSKQVQMVVSTGWPAYRGTQATVRTMQHRLYDCNWQMRLPDLGYASDMSIALTSYLNRRGNGGVIQLPAYGAKAKVMKIYVIALTGFAAVAVGCASFPDEGETRAMGEQAVASGYPGMPETLTRRAVQDEEQKLCSKGPKATLTSAEAARIVEASRASIKYPASGKLVGDWKAGAKLVASGAGMRVRGGRVEKVKQNGALCINCHALDPKEVNAGNLGPSLVAYGTQRGNSDATVKYTYEKIYNAWTYFPCSNMPRMGAHGFLTPEQITHVVAYLVEPASPVNRK